MKRILVALLLWAFFSGVLFSAESGAMPRLVLDHRVGINYVTHLFTLARLGYSDEEYSAKYASAVSKKDLDVLEKHKSQLSFALGETASLSRPFFFIPAKNDLKTKSDYLLYRNLWLESLEKRSLDFIKRYDPEALELGELPPDEYWLECERVRLDFLEVAQVFIDNIERYVTEVYPSIEPELIKKEEAVNARLSKLRVVQDWEDVLGSKWKHGDCTYLLFYAGKDGPSFNDLSKNLNSLHYNMDDAYMMAMLSHEFGIFLMRERMWTVFMEADRQYPPYKSGCTLGRVSWMAFEMLSVYFNTKINGGEKTLDYYLYGHSDPVAFMQIFDSLYVAGTTDAVELYKSGMAEYMKPGGPWEQGCKQRMEAFEEERRRKLGW